MRSHPEAEKAFPVEAEFRLATALIEQKMKHGIDSLRRLSASGYPPASYELGNCFYVGNLVERSEAKAVSKWREAASDGHILAELNLIKYDWHFANPLGKAVLIIKSTATLLWAVWLTFRNDGHDIRLIGNMDPRLKL